MRVRASEQVPHAPHLPLARLVVGVLAANGDHGLREGRLVRAADS